MINESLNQKIFSHGIQVDKPVLEWDEAGVTSGVTINAGTPVYIVQTADTTTGTVTGVSLSPVTAGVTPIGLSKSNVNSYVNEVTGALGGIYGSGKLAVVVKGIVTLRQNYFQNPVTGAIDQIKTFDDTVVWTPGTAVYVSINTANPYLTPSSASSAVLLPGATVLNYNARIQALQILLG